MLATVCHVLQEHMLLAPVSVCFALLAVPPVVMEAPAIVVFLGINYQETLV